MGSQLSPYRLAYPLGLFRPAIGELRAGMPLLCFKAYVGSVEELFAVGFIAIQNPLLPTWVMNHYPYK